MEWNYIYSSDLYRAYHTCCILLSKANNKSYHDIICQTNLLRELNFGVRESLSRSITKKQAMIEVAKRMNIAVSEVIDIAESYNEVTARQIAFITGLGHKFNIDHSSSSRSSMSTDGSITKVLCIAHGGYIKNFLRNFCKTIIVPDKIQNCGVNIITIEWPDQSDPTVFTCSTSEDQVNITYYHDQNES